MMNLVFPIHSKITEHVRLSTELTRFPVLFIFPLLLCNCPDGGIGRRAWFRSKFSQGCVGSSPVLGNKKDWSSWPVFLFIILIKKRR